MREKYCWAFPPTDDETTEIWRDGIISFDTNVLLDLYRSYESVRNDFFEILEKKRGNIWICHQVAEEFFRNRTNVIISSRKIFADENKKLDACRQSLDSILGGLKNQRVVDETVTETFLKRSKKLFDEILESVNNANETTPNFLKHDPVLDKIRELPPDCLGEPFSDEEETAARAEAIERFDNQIPPGYADQKNKDDQRAYGDYYLWKQLINVCQSQGKPAIFVTSDAKEDWWEEIDKQKTGPRPELLREFFENTQQRIILYRFDQFLEVGGRLSGHTLSSETTEEITRWHDASNRAVQAQQFVEIAEENEAKGRMKITLMRPVYTFTGTGKFSPQLAESPRLEVELVEYPADCPPCSLRAGVGTQFDFNVHLKSIEYGSHLPLGEYVFEYHATV